MDKAVFIDESGTPDLNNETYVISSVFAQRKHLEHDYQILKEIEKKYFSGNHLKSSNVGSNLKRRAKICEELGKLKSKVDLLVVDKSRVSKESGLRFKQSMYKFCQKRLFEKVYRGVDGIDVYMDSYGDKPFRESFKKYIDKHFRPTVFSQKSIDFKTTQEEPLIGVADFFAGTIRRYYSGLEDASAFESIKNSIYSLEVWPRVITDENIIPEDEELNAQIRNHCAHTAEEFLLRNKDEVQNEILEYLLYTLPIDPNGFIISKKILRHLKNEGLVEEDKKIDLIHQNIAKLREEGVVIAASREGYKIPECEEDLKDFINFVSEKTLKYLKRVMCSRDSLFRGTGNTYDILKYNNELFDLMRPLNLEAPRTDKE